MPSFRHCTLSAILLALVGCAAQPQPASGFHFVGDPATRQRLPPEGTAVQIAFAYNADIRSGEMNGVIHDIERCYHGAAPAGDVVALRNCMLLDYTAYNIDQLDGRQLNGAPMAYFRDDTLKARLAQYGPTAQFGSAAEMLAYLKDMHQLINRHLVHDWKTDSGHCVRNVTDPDCAI
jgi:hypothetical protein